MRGRTRHPATRAAIIETLLERKYITREGKSLAATDKGVELIEIVHPDVKSPLMTGQWEARLERIQRGSGDLESFMRDIETYVSDVVKRVRTATRGHRRRRGRHRRGHTSSFAFERDARSQTRPPGSAARAQRASVRASAPSRKRSAAR
jgi:DNA topoisomerase-3